MPLATGARLGRYIIDDPVGAGGMGEVYRARDARLNRVVAVKVLPAHLSSDPEGCRRFEREPERSVTVILNWPALLKR
jgi:serine/threonine protein kinase